MGRDDAVRAVAEHLRRPGGWNLWPADAERIARVAVDAAAPHLTADLVRERDEALAEVERYVRKVDDEAWRKGVVHGRLRDMTARAERAEAEVERLRAGWDADVDWANRLLVERDEARAAIDAALNLTTTVCTACGDWEWDPPCSPEHANFQLALLDLSRWRRQR